MMTLPPSAANWLPIWVVFWWLSSVLVVCLPKVMAVAEEANMPDFLVWVWVWLSWLLMAASKTTSPLAFRWMCVSEAMLLAVSCKFLPAVRVICSACMVLVRVLSSSAWCWWLVVFLLIKLLLVNCVAVCNWSVCLPSSNLISPVALIRTLPAWLLILKALPVMAASWLVATSTTSPWPLTAEPMSLLWLCLK